jgi:hypothetical protein
MRIAVLVLAVFGAMGAGLLGMMWLSDASKVNETTKIVKDLGLADDPKVKEAIAKANSHVTAAYLLLVAAVVALPAAIANLILPGKSKIIGIVLLACAIIPAVFAAKSLVFTFFLLIAGGLCLAMKSKQTAATPKVAYA